MKQYLPLILIIFVLLGALVFSNLNRISKVVSPRDSDNSKIIKEGIAVQDTEEVRDINKQMDERDSNDLSNKGLTSVPDQVIKDGSITALDISDNQIESLPSQVENWRNLVVFRAENNRMKSLPGEIRHWAKVKEIDVSGNGMTDLPAEIGQLKNLLVLDLSNNDIDEFPNEILNLKQLTTLDLRGNPVKPDHLQRMKDSLIDTEILY